MKGRGPELALGPGFSYLGLWETLGFPGAVRLFSSHPLEGNHGPPAVVRNAVGCNSDSSHVVGNSGVSLQVLSMRMPLGSQGGADSETVS